MKQVPTTPESANANGEIAPDEVAAPLEELETRVDAVRAAVLAAEIKATDIRVLRVRELVKYTDFFVICSARSDRQVSAVRDHIQSSMKAERGLTPLSVEGTETNQWAVVDFGDFVVHIFYEPVREFYQLEALWSDAPEIVVELPEAAPI